MKQLVTSNARKNFADIRSLIRSIQRAENKEICFKSGRHDCSQTQCKWRKYCLEDLMPLDPKDRTTGDFDAFREKNIMRVEPKHILCSTDFSELSNQALFYGVALAREFDAQLSVCHVIDLPTTGIDGGDVHLYPLETQNRKISVALDQIEQLMETHPVKWEPVVLIGHTSDEISRVVEVKKIDLAVSATHGRSGIKRMILGSVTERLMRTLTCPLLIVRDPVEGLPPAADPQFRFKRIVVGCDFSSDSALAFRYGLSLAQEFQSELHLIHVIEPPLYRDIRKIGAEQEENNQGILRRELEEKLTGMIPDDARHWCTLKTALMHGTPYKELINYARQHQMDLIILGVRGLSLMETLCLGSTTDRVVRRSSCPVLTVRPTLPVGD